MYPILSKIASLSRANIKYDTLFLTFLYIENCDNVSRSYGSYVRKFRAGNICNHAHVYLKLLLR